MFNLGIAYGAKVGLKLRLVDKEIKKCLRYIHVPYSHSCHYCGSIFGKRVIRSPSMRRRNIKPLNMDGLCHIEFYKRILVAPFIISVSINSKLIYRG